MEYFLIYIFLITEFWWNIPWYEWLYQASTFWNIKSLDRTDIYWRFRKETIMNPRIRYWYKWLSFCNLWKIRALRVNRLVAATFLWLDLNDLKTFVCHRNDIRDDNNVYNLFLWTHQDNMNDMARKWRSKWLKNKKILQYTKSWDLIQEWESLQLASSTLWLFHPNISKCCRWERLTTWWYWWKYK